MKKIMNSPADLVNEMLEGMAMAHPDLLAWNRKWRVVSRAMPRTDKVCLISGGGSGHEPAHAGLVGTGLLDAAVCGDVFASPSTIQVYNAIKASGSTRGTLLIIKNYSGDCMNFDAAAEMAADDDIVTKAVYVNDDVAVKDSLYTVGRRGVAGTVLVHKIAGAAAEAGLDLDEVARIAGEVIANVRSMGFALTSCTVPAKGSPTFRLGETEIEFGVGIHGEPGIERRPLGSAAELARDVMGRITEDLKLSKGEEVAVLVNGFGASPLQELYVLNREVQLLLAGQGVKVHRTMVGNYMTSIDMAGASVSVLRLNAELKNWLDAPALSPALTVSGRMGVKP